MIKYNIRLFSRNIKEEIENSVKSNGVHKIIFYRYKKNFITYAEYLEHQAAGLKPKVLEHMGFKYNFNIHYSVFSLCTSKPTTKLPGLDVKIDNIKALDGTFYEYINPPIFIQNNVFAKYCTISDKIDEFPSFIKKLDKTLIVEYTIENFINSYNIASQNENSLYVKANFDRLCYGYNVHQLFISSHLGVLSPYYSWLYFNESSKNVSVEEIEKFTYKMAHGFEENDINIYLSALL